jgi:hypothetical protein
MDMDINIDMGLGMGMGMGMGMDTDMDMVMGSIKCRLQKNILCCSNGQFRIHLIQFRCISIL